MIALRAAGTFSYVRKGNVVPFYMQPTIGGPSDVRGLPRFRYYGNNSIVGNAEYRWEVAPALDMALFADAGRVQSTFLASFMARLPFVAAPPSGPPPSSEVAGAGGNGDGAQAAWRRYQYLVRHAEVDGARGGYVGWLTKIGSQRFLDRPFHPAAAGILAFLDRGGPVADYERLADALIEAASDVK